MPVQFCSGLSTKMEVKSKVCRNLFGSPNHEELRKDLDNQLKELNAMSNTHMKNTWSFDPEMDSGILDGRYEWTLLKSDEYVPEVYRKAYRPTKFRKFRKVHTLSQETPPTSPVCSAVLARLQGPTTEEKFVEDMENLRRENETTPENKVVPVKQTRIGDFMRVKKPSKRRLEDDLSDDEPSSKSQRV